MGPDCYNAAPMADLYPPLQFLPSLSAVIRGEPVSVRMILACPDRSRTSPWMTRASVCAPVSPFFFIANTVIDRLNQTPIQRVTIVLCSLPVLKQGA